MTVALSADLDWQDHSDVIVVREQFAVAVYQNPHGAVVIRQERAWNEDGDTYILIQPAHAAAVADAILRAAGFDELSHDRTASTKDRTAADRQRRRRDKLRDNGVTVTPPAVTKGAADG